MTEAVVPVSMDPFGAFVSFCTESNARDGPLRGLTLAVKDNIAIAGEPYGAGLPLYAGRIAERDADIVARLKAAGARVVGVTRSDAAGLSVTTLDVNNPALPGHVVGGSSGGSAAAVAADMAAIGLGTDTGGSVRIPAACCSLIGVKPTHGVWPTAGLWPLATEFDTPGVITRDFSTLDRVAAVLLDNPTEQAPASLRLGVDRQRLASCDPVVAAALNDALSRLTTIGIEVVEVVLPDRDVTARAHGVIVLEQARSLYAQAWRTTPHLFPDPARRALTAAEKLTSDNVRAARDIAVSARAQCLAACETVDAIIMPTLPILPPRCDAHRVMLAGRDVPVVVALVAETCLANVAGVPALSMPCPNPQGAFVSLQLLAPQGHDTRLIAIAHRLALLLSAK